MVTWLCGALALSKDNKLSAPPRENPQYWHLLRTFLPNADLLSSKRAHQLLHICAAAYGLQHTTSAARAAGDSAGDSVARAAALDTLRFVDRKLGSMSVRVEHRHVLKVVEQLAEVGSYEKEPVLVEAFDLCLRIWQRAAVSLSVKKRFEAFLQYLLIPSCRHLYLTRIEVEAPQGFWFVLPTFSLSQGIDIEGEEARQRSLPEAAGMIALRKMLFDPSHVAQFYSSFTNWQDRWQRQSTEKHAKKRKRNDLLVSYHRLLLERLRSGLSSPESCRVVCANLPNLLHLYHSALASTSTSTNANTNTAEGAGSGGRKRESLSCADTNTSVFAFYYELTSLILSSDVPVEAGLRYNCLTALTLTLLRTRVYETSSAEMLVVLRETVPLLVEALSTEAGPMAASSLIAMLEVDHRVLADNLPEIVSALCESYSPEGSPAPAAGFSFNASVELLLRLLHVFAKLRRMEEMVLVCLDVKVEPRHGVDLLLEAPFKDGLGRVWRSLPPTQYVTQWQAMLKRLEHEISQRTCVWFHIFCASLSVDQQNAKQTLNMCNKALELFEQRDSSPAGLLLITTLHELKQLCVEKDESLREMVQPLRFLDWKEKLKLDEGPDTMDAKAKACLLLLRYGDEIPQNKLCLFVVAHASLSLIYHNVRLIATLSDTTRIAALTNRIIDDFDIECTVKVSRSPFTHARFYEIQELRENMGKLLCDRIERLAKKAQWPALNATFELIAAMPRSYLPIEAARSLLAVVGKLSVEETRIQACAVFCELGAAHKGLLCSHMKFKDFDRLVFPPHRLSDNLTMAYAKDLLKDDASAARFVRFARRLADRTNLDLVVASMDPFVAQLRSLTQPLSPPVQQLLLTLHSHVDLDGKSSTTPLSFRLYATLFRMITAAGRFVDSQLSDSVLKLLPRYISMAAAVIIPDASKKTANPGMIKEGADWEAAAFLVMTVCANFHLLPSSPSDAFFSSLVAVVFSMLSRSMHAQAQHPLALRNMEQAVVELFRHCTDSDSTEVDLLLHCVEKELRAKEDKATGYASRVETGLRASRLACEALAHGAQKRIAWKRHAKVLLPLVVDVAAIPDYSSAALEVLLLACKRFPEWLGSRKGESTVMYIMVGMVGVLAQEKSAQESLGAVLKVLSYCVRLNSAVVVKGALVIAQVSQHAVRLIAETGRDDTEAIERLSQELSAHGKAFKHYAVHWVVAYVDICRRSAMVAHIRAGLDEAAYHWLDMCDEHELQQIHALLRSTNRLIFKDLHERYERVHKYRGRV